MAYCPWGWRLLAGEPQQHRRLPFKLPMGLYSLDASVSNQKSGRTPNLSLADFIMPAGDASDYMGAFSVTIQGIEQHISRFEKNHDDYNKIMLQALVDRLAEAFAELLHEETRKNSGDMIHRNHYPTKTLSVNHTVAYDRHPAIGLPDHTEKNKLFRLLGGEKSTGITLTESLAMYPASSVCGWYIAHPDSKYFGVGKISNDQLEDYARRKGMDTGEARKWLNPILED